ncbi:hypothetical protein SAMN05444920_121117 [Nonomuraea solani]|uniref:Neocarzinostatin family protein n=1 Tax=Nonomuraea solani TaxID=1144553 RepID=A0A1H6EXP1_9ACTN|nr:hypothetical protein [Nonomuraea solani]SEH01669.1 hypothetical protein SAMN05444920_121117 [Nonomuraea solani]
MRQRWVLLLAGLAVCALSPAVPAITLPMTPMARQTPLDPAGESLVEDTFYLTEGIEVSQWLLPTTKGVRFRPAYLAVGVKVDESGHLTGRPQRSGTYVAPVQVCAGQACRVQDLTLVVLGNVPWEPRELTFPGKAGTALKGEIGINGGPTGVVPTFTVTDFDKLPEGVSIGPDGQVGGVPEKPGISEVPVRICVAGNCAGVVVRLIIV